MKRRYLVTVDDPDLSCKYVFREVWAENDRDAERATAKRVCELDSRANAGVEVHVARYAVALPLGEDGRTVGYHVPKEPGTTRVVHQPIEAP